MTMYRPVPPSISDIPEDKEKSMHLLGTYGVAEKNHRGHGNKPHKATLTLTLSRVYSVALHVLVLVLAGSLWSTNRRPSSIVPVQQGSWSPVNDVVEYELSSTHAVHNEHSQYAGPPTEDKDAAWHSLLRPVHFNATRDELQKAGESMTNITELEGGGHPASLGVYHELHCVRQMRLYLYQEHYYPNMTEAQHEYVRSHLDHCMETLRLAIMCRGSTDVYSFYWNGSKTGKPATQSSTTSVCVAWSSIEKWALTRIPATTRLVGETQTDSHAGTSLQETRFF